MRIKQGVLLAAALLMVSTASYAAGRYAQVTAYLTDDVTFQKAGVRVPLTHSDGSTAVPLNYGGRLYVPVRAVSELLGTEVHWNDTTRTVNFGAEEAASSEESGYASVSAAHYAAFSALKTKDYSALAALAHPTKGIRFSMNGRVEPASDIVLTRAQLEDRSIGVRDFRWGVEDGSGVDYTRTVSQFFDRFNRDFENPSKSGHDQRVTSMGILETPGTATRVIEGAGSLYAGGVFEETCFAGASGLEFDWDSFVLVFELYEGQYRLVGVLHNHWLI